ncbi:hypothetical protein I4I83_12745 [Acidovorax cattleyae]|nr:hypothetical protein [Paracidovorax cattleyae]
MIVIAVVVTIYTAGAMSAAAGATFSETMAAGAAALAPGGSLSIAGAAVAGAAGSIASQAVGVAIGAQKNFSWKSVALAAVSSGVTAGIGNANWLPDMGTFANAAMRQAVSGTISQGIGTVTGLQPRFDWKGVVAGAIGAGVGASVGSALDKANAFGSWGSDFAMGLARGTVSGLAAGLTTAVMKGGRVSVQQVATDAFGHALAESLVSSSISAFRNDEILRQTAQESLRMEELRAASQATESSPYALGSAGTHLGLQAKANDWDRALTQAQQVQDPVEAWKETQIRDLVRKGDYGTAAELRAADVRLTSEGLRIREREGGGGLGPDDMLAFQPPSNPQLQRLLERAELPTTPAEAPAANGLQRALGRLVRAGGVGLGLATYMRDPETTDWQIGSTSFSYNQDDFTLRVMDRINDGGTGAKLAIPGIHNPSQYTDAQYLSYVTYKANGGQLSIDDFASLGLSGGDSRANSKNVGFDVTDAVTISGRRAIDMGQSYEIGVRELYGNVPFKQREYEAFVNGEWMNGVADNVTRVNGKNTAVEAKFVEDWSASLRNPNGQSGQYPWSIREQQKMVDQASKYSAGFEGGVLYHTNSAELATHYSTLFSNLGIQNFKFVITPAIRK